MLMFLTKNFVRIPNTPLFFMKWNYKIMKYLFIVILTTTWWNVSSLSSSSLHYEMCHYHIPHSFMIFFHYHIPTPSWKVSSLSPSPLHYEMCLHYHLPHSIMKGISIIILPTPLLNVFSLSFSPLHDGMCRHYHLPHSILKCIFIIIFSTSLWMCLHCPLSHSMMKCVPARFKIVSTTLVVGPRTFPASHHLQCIVLSYIKGSAGLSDADAIAWLSLGAPSARTGRQGGVSDCSCVGSPRSAPPTALCAECPRR